MTDAASTAVRRADPATAEPSRVPIRPVLHLLWVAAALCASPARADLGFPAYVKFPPQVVINPDQALDEKTQESAEFTLDASGNKLSRSGHYYARWLTWKPLAGEPAVGFYNGSEARISTAVGKALVGSGWTRVYQNEAQDQATFRIDRDGQAVYATLSMDAPQGYVRFEMVEPAAAPTDPVFRSPAAVAEKFGDDADFPWLPPPPGATRTWAGHNDDTLDVSPPGAAEPMLVGSRVLGRNYSGPKTLAAGTFFGQYQRALAKAGWTIVHPKNGSEAADGRLIARYHRDGRELWAKLTYEYGAQLSFQVVDIGGGELDARLAKDCHVPLYGVLFDFNQASLKPESDSVLGAALALLKGKPALKIEVQGHTDNVGGDDYNQKLSEARATTVESWLVAHGIAAARLSHKGYGRNQPIADNGSDAGRARNRRVELKDLGCR